MKNIFFFLIVSLAFVSCKKEEQEKPKVIYESKSQAKPQVDTTKVVVADLPVHMEGTNMLIFPVGDLNFNKKNAQPIYLEHRPRPFRPTLYPH